MKTVRRTRGPVARVLIPLVWALAAVDVLILVWMLLSSLKETREMVLEPFSWPSHFAWDNYEIAWTSGQFGDGVLNSLVLVVGSGVGCIVLAAPAAYALARFQIRGAGTHLSLFVLGLGIPAQTMFIPLYVAFDKIGLTDSVWGLMLIYIGAGIPYALFLLTAFFRSMPTELEQAGAIDGASPWYVFWRIMLPLARSGLITIFVMQAIGHWSETFFALVMLQTKTTLSLSLYNFMQTMQYTGSRYSVLFAGLIIIVGPLLVAYLWLGRRIVEGIAAGYSR
ncbi:carbohydrate ABC transporter permease [Dactylosporangium salmoneum]|uniref:Carbohydrate ABC transporter permease n=1 Tax=Dactylosporangium salmoneum TaxID=53361 RepID=A0ABP5UXR0_9ACTN